MNLEARVTISDLRDEEYGCLKKLNGARFELEKSIARYSDKHDGQLVFSALQRFLQVQSALAKKLVPPVASPQDYLGLATWIAAQEGTGALGSTSPLLSSSSSLSFFENKQVDYRGSWQELSSSQLELYCQAMKQMSSSMSLEALTQSFFGWCRTTASSTLQQFASHSTLHVRLEKKKYVVDRAALMAVPEQEPAIDTEAISFSQEAEHRRDEEKINEADYLHGLDHVRQELERVVRIVAHKEYLLTIFPAKKLFRNYLLVGPPGTGKTTLVQNLAVRCGLYFLPVPCVTLGSSFFSKTASNIHDRYRLAYRQMQEQDLPGAIIFFDEIDHIAKQRGYGHSSEGDSLVTTLNENLDGGSSKPGIITIGATNVEQMIDPAVLSKFHRLHIPYPQEDKDIIGIHEAVIRKIEAYAQRAVFAARDYGKILPFAQEQEGYRSGRIIDRVLHAAALEKVLQGAAGKRFELVTTSDIVHTYHLTHLEETSPPKGSPPSTRETVTAIA